ncbi:hypothetical protein SCHPADRAFT_1000973 [Schizopora paradoxa]|uniref:BTB domain-containing protein n=1 Tax=Schizopora paradoxa TaxID=27342 RepID=A0A0H2RFR4_9AGAM|nr:hypothetical protein SCHPADRAFT_1000973 [Schizopora paradoxa]
MNDHAQGIDATPGPKPFEALWFSDGNVILATDTYLFKVHKSMLSSQSSVFRDMFDLPLVGDSQGPSEGDRGIVPETYDGLPLVKLADEKGEELAYLLRAVYERQFYHRDDARTPLKVVTSLLVLSTKYDFEHIRKDVIFQISKHYPMTLDEYCAIDDDKSQLFGMDRKDCHFPLLGAAFTAQVEPLLPILYYAASHFYAGDIFQAFTSGTIAMECCKTLFNGRESLQSSTNLSVASMRESLAQIRSLNKDKACQTQGCTLDVPDDHQTPFSSFLNTSDQKYVGGQQIIKSFFPQLCSNCFSECAKYAESERSLTWAWIPMAFAHSKWEDIHKELEELLSEDV